MKTNLITVPVGVNWLVSKLVARLHQLKEKGVLTEEEFNELKEKMKARI